MLFENILFSIFKNRKVFYVFWLSNVFSYFLFILQNKKTTFENNYLIKPYLFIFFHLQFFIYKLKEWLQDCNQPCQAF